MSKRKKNRKVLAGCEHQSDRRTAEFVLRRLTEIQDELCDLIPDLRTFEQYSEIEDLTWCTFMLQRLKRKYRKFLDHGVWETE